MTMACKGEFYDLLDVDGSVLFEDCCFGYCLEQAALFVEPGEVVAFDEPCLLPMGGAELRRFSAYLRENRCVSFEYDEPESGCPLLRY